MVDDYVTFCCESLDQARFLSSVLELITFADFDSCVRARFSGPKAWQHFHVIGWVGNCSRLLLQTSYMFSPELTDIFLPFSPRLVFFSRVWHSVFSRSSDAAPLAVAHTTFRVCAAWNACLISAFLFCTLTFVFQSAMALGY